jgi:hypothetical protein
MAIAIAEDERIGPVPARQTVIVGTAIQHIVAVAPGQPVIAVVAEKRIVAVMAIKFVVALKPGNVVRIGRTVDDVTTRCSGGRHGLSGSLLHDGRSCTRKIGHRLGLGTLISWSKG